MRQFYPEIAFILALLAIPPLGAQSPLIWFCPLDPLFREEVGYGGSQQYMQLFAPDARWQNAASRVHVFKIYPQWIAEASDDDLRTQFADLKRRGIALALEWGILTASDSCGQGVEGFSGQFTLPVVRRIQRLGGGLRYIAFDEPIYFGTLYQGPNACRWTLEEMAQNAAANVKALHAEFPEILAGDIEPLPVDDADPNWLDRYARGIDALQSALPAPLAFVHSDLAWFAARWPAALAAMRQVVESRGLAFGVIYNGESEPSDAEWIAEAEAHMTAYEATAASPDHVIFQSWNRYPQKLLPETDTGSFTNLIDRYFRARTQLTVAAAPGALSGTLVSGDPVFGAPVRVTATQLSGSGVETEYSVEGIAPPGVQQIVFGARVGAECGCQGASDFRLRSFRFESGDSAISRDFRAGLAEWGVSDVSAVIVEDGQLHVRTAADRPVVLNSVPSAFRGGNMRFKLTVTATVSPASTGSGYFMAAFLGGRELDRVRAPIAAPTQDLGVVMTGDGGQFQLALPPLAPVDWLLRAIFAGNPDLWPARAEVKLTAN